MIHSPEYQPHIFTPVTELSEFVGPSPHFDEGLPSINASLAAIEQRVIASETDSDAVSRVLSQLEVYEAVEYERRPMHPVRAIWSVQHRLPHVIAPETGMYLRTEIRASWQKRPASEIHDAIDVIDAQKKRDAHPNDNLPVTRSKAKSLYGVRGDRRLLGGYTYESPETRIALRLALGKEILQHHSMAEVRSDVVMYWPSPNKERGMPLIEETVLRVRTPGQSEGIRSKFDLIAAILSLES